VLTSLQTISPQHFDPPVEFLDLFLPTNIASECRARAFLWLIFHYHEGQDIPNPFADAYSQKFPNKVPWLRRMTVEEQQLENRDTPEELVWGKKMGQQRSLFLQDLMYGPEDKRQPRVVASTSQST
jgi:Ino eighty subunit 1